MRVSKKYEQLVLMYKYNPISDTTLFKNMQTQHFYKKMDFTNIVQCMYQYIYWGDYTKKLENVVKKVNKKKYLCSEYDKFYNFSDRLVSKNIDHRHIMTLLHGLPFQCNKMIYDSSSGKSFDRIDESEKSDVLIHIFYDDDNNSIAFLKGYNVNRSYEYYSNSINRITYYDSLSDIRLFDQKNKNFTVYSNSKYVLLTFKTNCELIFSRSQSMEGSKYALRVDNKGFTAKELSSLMFPKSITSRVNPYIRFNARRYVVYSLSSNFNDDYYKSLLKKSFGREFNVLLDSWVVPYGVEYNLGYLRYIYYDEFGNSIMYNILPTQILVTTLIKGVLRNYKPLCDMVSFIKHIKSSNVYDRYVFETKDFAKYYNTTFNDMIYPLRNFEPNRLFVCTNQMTRCSCVRDKNYFIRVKNSNLVNY